MYEALIARIRYHIQKANFMGLKEAESTLLLGEAADAIEELSLTVDSYKRSMEAWAEEAYRAYSKYAKSIFGYPKEE